MRAVRADGESRDDDAPDCVTLAAVGQPPLCERRETRGLPRVDCLRRRDERSRTTRLHLDERVTTRVAADQVDLTETRADVASDDAETTTGELAFCQVLAGESEEAARLHARFIGRALRQGCVAVIRRTLSPVPLLVVR